MRAPDLDQIGLCPVEIELLGPHEDEGIVPVVGGEKEPVRLGFDEDLALFDRNLEYRCVLVRAPSFPCAFKVGWPWEVVSSTPGK